MPLGRAAIRHAQDHIHVAATFVREDGRKPTWTPPTARIQDEACRLGAGLGLTDQPG